MNKFVQRGVGIAVIAMLLAACGGTAPATGGTVANADALRVVATTSILGDFVQNVGGERVSVKVLLPPGTDPHTFSPAPSDAQAVADAQVLVENGLGLEAWLEELTANAGGERTTITASGGLTTLHSHEEGGEHADDHSAEASGEHADDHSAEASGEHADEHGHGEGGDPHMWLNVQHAIGYVQAIRDGLKRADPAGANTYDANAAAYIKQLEQLDAEIVQAAEGIPEAQRKLITNHDTFGYFGQRYGFTIVGSVFEGTSTEQEPSAQQIAALVEQIRAENVRAVFTENTVNPRLAQQLADEANIKVVSTLYTDALGASGSDGDTYLKMMRFNIKEISAALQ